KYGRANRRASRSTPVARRASRTQRRMRRRRAWSRSTASRKWSVPISTRRARRRNSRWITIGTATAAAAARNPGWMKPSPPNGPPRSGSEELRSSRQVFVERPLERLLGGHRDPVDPTAAAAGVQLVLPGGDGGRVAGADLLHLGRQLLAGLQV